MTTDTDRAFGILIRQSGLRARFGTLADMREAFEEERAEGDTSAELLERLNLTHLEDIDLGQGFDITPGRMAFEVILASHPNDCPCDDCHDAQLDTCMCVDCLGHVSEGEGATQ